ncbi:hypothetical protein PoB_007683300 [Plakobranchus ocellatus]|uniref:Uncharacterized protein n=1 Tax=Plakobranchus ocellatus TaxID=259542 RepID=A0AAV4E185_9GAST|nr:hypothetical protein PoB_007683300 [Plakobranchus ocellatus]
MRLYLASKTEEVRAHAVTEMDADNDVIVPDTQTGTEKREDVLVCTNISRAESEVLHLAFGSLTVLLEKPLSLVLTLCKSKLSPKKF